LTRFLDLSQQEFKGVAWSFLYFFFLLSSYYILRPVRDEMGIRGGVDQLQWLFTGTFMAMVIAVPVFAWFASRYPRRTLLPVVYLFFIANLLCFYGLFQLDVNPVYTARAFFIWLSVFNLFAVSVFWSFIVDIFNAESAKRLFGIIAAGGSAGAIAGPLLTASLVGAVGVSNLLLVASLLLALALLCIGVLRRWAGSNATESAPALGGNIYEGIVRVVRSRYLLGICGYILLYTTVATILYFTQARIVAAEFDTAVDRTQIFALMDFAVNTLTVVLQLLVTGRLVSRFGVALALVLLPAVVTIGLLSFSIAPVLGVLLVVQVSRRAVNFAIARPVREMLYTVLPRVDRYKSKNIVDTLVYRGGDALSGWAYAVSAAAGAGLATIAALAVPLALAWCALAYWLGRRYDDLSAASEK
jgi:AAA family ATP:ADP antiporter